LTGRRQSGTIASAVRRSHIPGVVIVRRGATRSDDGSVDTQSGTMEPTGGTMRPHLTSRPDAYAFVFGATDLLTGVGIEGWKIIRVNP
jgi:hypothetical protein